MCKIIRRLLGILVPIFIILFFRGGIFSDQAITANKNKLLTKLRIGDIVAIKDHYNYYGRGRYEGAVTIGVVIHGFSDFAGHGPGLDPILSAMPGKIELNFDPDANMAYYLGIRSKSD